MILYVEPFSGLSGDMFLSALCALANAYEEIEQLPEKLHLHDGRIEIRQLNKNGIACKHLKVIDRGASQRTGHAAATALHSHSHGHEHSQAHGEHRHLRDIIALIDAAHIPGGAKSIARQIFTLIGESESRIHDIPLEDIHFHEVSGVDSILDIVGCAWLLDRLGITQTYSDPVCVGYGEVMTQHGRLPVPAPATADLLRGMPSYKGEEAGERCTPTGAAILRYLDPVFESCPHPAHAIAYGPGQKDFQSANVLRLSLARPRIQSDSVWIIETSLDDMSPELLGIDFQDRLLASGALDFHFTPIQMKKGRPGLLLAALAPSDRRDAVADFILEETTTLGVRYYPAQRRVLERKQTEVRTAMGTILAKEAIKPSGAKQRKLEHASLEKLADELSISITELKRRLNEA